MSIDLLLAEDVSWRTCRGPRPWVMPEWYGPNAYNTARALAMVPIEGWPGMWAITDKTPELAERALCDAWMPKPKTKPPNRSKRSKPCVRAS